MNQPDSSAALVVRGARVPGPRLFQVPLVTLDLLRHGERCIDRLFDRHGDVFSLKVPEAIPGVSRIVIFRDPTLIKSIFTETHEQLSNDGNLPIVDLYGTQSMVL